ncbi:MAG: hypothetical protein IPG53_06580 [Ignavibacteriales bacterium]|nr:hypothetical protein [Ignavibacteriales bacterium]
MTNKRYVAEFAENVGVRVVHFQVSVKEKGKGVRDITLGEAKYLMQTDTGLKLDELPQPRWTLRSKCLGGL